MDGAWNALAAASRDLAFDPAELRGDAVRAAEKRKQPLQPDTKDAA